MENLSALAQICITLIEEERITEDLVPSMVKEEVTNFYKNKEKKGENINV